VRRTIMTYLASVAIGVSATFVVAAPASATFAYRCFGYLGNFKDGTKVLWADWTKDDRPDECFGIGPDRRIWHAWPNSGGFKVMPNNGLADDTLSWRVTGEGVRQVVVYVASDRSHWYSNWYPGSEQGWYGWHNCDGQC